MYVHIFKKEIPCFFQEYVVLFVNNNWFPIFSPKTTPFCSKHPPHPRSGAFRCKVRPLPNAKLLGLSWHCPELRWWCRSPRPHRHRLELQVSTDFSLGQSQDPRNVSWFTGKQPTGAEKKSSEKSECRHLDDPWSVQTNKTCFWRQLVPAHFVHQAALTHWHETDGNISIQEFNWKKINANRKWPNTSNTLGGFQNLSTYPKFEVFSQPRDEKHPCWKNSIPKHIHLVHFNSMTKTFFLELPTVPNFCQKIRLRFALPTTGEQVPKKP